MVTHIHTLGNTDDPLPDGQQTRSRKPKRRAQRKTARHISGGPLTRVRAAVDAHRSHATEAEAVASEATSPDSLEGTRGEDNVAAKWVGCLWPRIQGADEDEYAGARPDHAVEPESSEEYSYLDFLEREQARQASRASSSPPHGIAHANRQDAQAGAADSGWSRLLDADENGSIDQGVGRGGNSGSVHTGVIGGLGTAREMLAALRDIERARALECQRLVIIPSHRTLTWVIVRSFCQDSDLGDCALLLPPNTGRQDCGVGEHAGG